MSESAEQRTKRTECDKPISIILTIVKHVVLPLDDPLNATPVYNTHGFSSRAENDNVQP